MSVTAARKGRAITAVALAAAAGAGGSAEAQQAERVELSGSRIAIYNLAGEATLEAGSGSTVVVQVQRQGPEADRLAIERGPIGDAQTLRVTYPADEILYRPEGRMWRGSSTVRVREDGTFGDGWNGRGRERGREVRVRTTGRGLEAHANLRIAVPRGSRLDLFLAVGRISATNVDGELRLHGGATDVTTSETTGRLVVDVGSGSVRVTNARGYVNVDTGSGEVEVSGVSGDELLVDTGSGGVTVRDATATTVNVDTGSGDVSGSNVSADVLRVDTGSGSVDLAFTRAPRDISVDTGSGSVTLVLPPTYTATVNLETGSGDISLDFPVQIRRWQRDEVRGTIGDGAGRLTVETGSGSIHIRKS